MCEETKMYDKVPDATNGNQYRGGLPAAFHLTPQPLCLLLG